MSVPEPDARPSATEPAGRSQLLALVAVLVVAAILRLIDLNAQLWIDEISALKGSIERPAWRIATVWPGPASHVLYELLAHLGLVTFGTEPWAIRLPAALAGVAGIWALHRLAARVLNGTAALAAAGLAAVSFHHVFYSQNARGYTLLLFFFLVATERLIAMDRKGAVSRTDGLVYAGAGALAGYSQLFGVVVMPAQLAAVALLAWVGHRRPRVPLRPFAAWAVGGIVVMGVLYLPFVTSVMSFAAERVGVEAEGPRLGLGLIREAMNGLAAGLGGPVGLAVAVAVGLVGFVVWVRSDGRSLVFLVAPLVLQASVFLVLGTGAHARYFAVALPTVLMVGAAGLDAVLRAGAGLARVPATVRGRVVAVALVGVVAVSAAPLARYYRYPKQDFLGAAQILNERAEPGDIRTGVHVAGSAIRALYDPEVVRIRDLDQLRALEARGRRVWVVTSLESILAAYDATLLDHIHREYERVAFLPGTVGDGHVRVYVREAGP